MYQPLISINIPVYKCENHIERCLKSVIKQSYKNIEIILVNDCTPDDSVLIIENIINLHPEIPFTLIHHKENRGLSVVRNTGIKESKGDYLFFLDSDDEITFDCIEKLVLEANKTKANLIIAQNRWINTFDNSTKDYGFPTQTNQKYFDTNESIFKAYCQDVFPITSWNKLINTQFILNHNIFFVEGLYGQDELWMFHVMEKLDTLAIIDDITYLYYLHGDSVIFNRTKKNFENYMTILSYFTKSYTISNNLERKDLIKKKIINFKNMVMIMQWKAMRSDRAYFDKNYKRMKSFTSFNIIDYFRSTFDQKTKKLNFQQNLPTKIGTNLFIKRFG